MGRIKERDRERERKRQREAAATITWNSRSALMHVRVNEWPLTFFMLINIELT